MKFKFKFMPLLSVHTPKNHLCPSIATKSQTCLIEGLVILDNCSIIGHIRG